ncbi:hypothetical protein BB381_05100 [Campylobacter pinnipediorum subsp. caledonicus]|uniref:3-oxoacyl-[acyl-carrier-protein] synthase III C-terminal domain-containing protein n=1 Tax=Campylobacter pinnipediorum TaxID=1965231 RepID=UPI000995CD1B|nr:3-oxoacyl-[acyl-carrier-protein] synthase III C-terminal domain-containing protein [Campylobacter pinnipediorum]AQW86803.1 3-oxoacyl-[acp] synthase III [Campylobacter pinnipediorum subsp. caledonicus]OPA72578.1 hypothetical protein BB381_05100 [Campylobacter pinnipediorum subsp. caledonicus]
MQTIFYGKKISGILTLLPETEYSFEKDMEFNSLSQKQNIKLQKTMGYNKHRIFKDNSYVSKIAGFGLNYMFKKNMLRKEDISAIVLSTTTPDFLIPPTSNLIMNEANLDNSVFCMDIKQQCAGFTNGLLQAFMLLNNIIDAKKVILITGDVLYKKPDRSNTSSYPMTGDAICITVLENTSEKEPIYFHSVVDAKLYDALVFPSLGFRDLTNDEKEKFSSKKYGKCDSLNCLHMDGQEVFQYVMHNVSKYINETINFSNFSKDEIEYYFFHQPNKFMVDKLAQKLELPHEKVPSNVVTYYGNSNSSTIPVCICHNAKDELTYSMKKCMLAGFGAGLTYSGVIINLGKFDFCEMLITKF